MAQKAKAQKQKPQPKQKVQRFVPNINLLKNINAVFLVAGFVASLFTVFVLSQNTPSDIRTRGQEIAAPTLTPIESPTPTPTPEFTGF